jgi:hypothetical protein
MASTPELLGYRKAGHDGLEGMFVVQEIQGFTGSLGLASSVSTRFANEIRATSMHLLRQSGRIYAMNPWIQVTVVSERHRTMNTAVTHYRFVRP